MKTQYSDFLDYYLKYGDNDSEGVTKFKKDILENYEMWSDAERAFGTYTQKFDGVELSAEKFCDFHQNFCEALAIYLQDQEICADLQYKKLGIPFGMGIKHFAEGLREVPSERINSYIKSFNTGFQFSFVSFNYTLTLDKCIKDSDTLAILGTRSTRSGVQRNIIKDLIHVHGTTLKDMVLGVNDEKQIANTDLFKNKDYEYMSQIIKPKTNELNEENIVEKTKKIIQNSDLLYIYGMSIGETDAIWWNEICSVMNRKKNMYLILHAYDAPEETLIRTNYLKFERERKNKLVSFSDISPMEKDNIVNRIIVTKNNIFGALRKVSLECIANADI